MLDLGHPRDLIMIGAIFGMAAFVWAGWAQERPPQTRWRIYLGALSLAGLALLGISLPAAIRSWGLGTAIEPREPAFAVYVGVVAIEVVAAVVAAVVLARSRRAELIAPVILLVVGVHFFPLAFVFHQPLLHLAAAALSAVAVAAFLLPRRAAAPSFWCGALGAPIFLGLGAWALLGGLAAVG